MHGPETQTSRTPHSPQAQANHARRQAPVFNLSRATNRSARSDSRIDVSIASRRGRAIEVRRLFANAGSRRRVRAQFLVSSSRLELPACLFIAWRCDTPQARPSLEGSSFALISLIERNERKSSIGNELLNGTGTASCRLSRLPCSGVEIDLVQTYVCRRTRVERDRFGVVRVVSINDLTSATIPIVRLRPRR